MRIWTTPGMPAPKASRLRMMPAQGHPAEIDAVIGPLPRYEAEALPLATGPVIGHRDLHGAVDGLGAGVAEEDLLHALRRDAGHPAGGLEGNGMAAVEGRSEVQLLELAMDGVDDLLAAVARALQNRPAVPSRIRSPLWLK